jgi:hypothetical protein
MLLRFHTLYDLKLSRQLNAIKLPWAGSRVRWLKSDKSFQPSYMASSQRELYCFTHCQKLTCNWNICFKRWAFILISPLVPKSLSSVDYTFGCIPSAQINKGTSYWYQWTWKFWGRDHNLFLVTIWSFTCTDCGIQEKSSVRVMCNTAMT